MTLAQLKESIDYALLNGHSGDESVLITLKEPSIGPRASVVVSSASCGFDWEHYQFRIEPEVPLKKDGCTRDDPIETYAVKYIYEKRTKLVHHCRNCDRPVNKDAHYCENCGQKIKISNKVAFVHDYRSKQN